MNGSNGNSSSNGSNSAHSSSSSSSSSSSCGSDLMDLDGDSADNIFASKESLEGREGAEGRESKESREGKESAARRHWAISAESVLITLQQSNAALRYSPLVIAVAALKYTEPVGLQITMDVYLRGRFGEAASVLLEQFQVLSAMVETAGRPIDLGYLKAVCMERLKKESVWSKAKVKKPKGAGGAAAGLGEPASEQSAHNVASAQMEVS